jgi:hypothetical protein
MCHLPALPGQGRHVAWLCQLVHANAQQHTLAPAHPESQVPMGLVTGMPGGRHCQTTLNASITLSLRAHDGAYLQAQHSNAGRCSGCSTIKLH